MQTGMYSAWDNIELPLEGPDEDYFEDFTSSSQDDYTFFLPDHEDADGRKVKPPPPPHTRVGLHHM
jgi:hypothetical protein